ncbi:MAG: phage tail protein, partial [Aeromonas salmonicida]
GIGWEHLPEPPEDPYDGITWELFINGEYQPWPPTN